MLGDQEIRRKKTSLCLPIYRWLYHKKKILAKKKSQKLFFPHFSFYLKLANTHPFQKQEKTTETAS
jgi:hypothetical protein